MAISTKTDPLGLKKQLSMRVSVARILRQQWRRIGDFPGLISKLDYLEDLGVNTMWLLPFFPLATQG